MLKLVTLCALLSVVPGVAFAAPPEPPPAVTARSPRVRAADDRTIALLSKGLERSATIRELVRKLEQRDVIVYVETQPTLKKRLAGHLTWVNATRTHRYVRISINPELGTDTAISTLGHELQHALEVANAPEIVSLQSLERYYAQFGDISRAEANGWDTEAARAAGEDVRRELAAMRTNRVTDSIQQMDPDDWLVVYRRSRGMLPP
jgi:hypothetical protein